jgi:peptidoglycan/LPS O-acetylase OafA/YrhL
VGSQARSAGDDDGHRQATAERRSSSRALGAVFDPRNNSLNAWRLVLATGVILWHSWPITGRQIAFEPAHQLLRDVWVDGFFAISGFLITWSWFRNPRLRDYLLARGLRLLPAFWVCLIVIAFIIAPVAVAIQGGAPMSLLFSSAPVEYVLNNSALMLRQNDIAGTPTGVPLTGEWDTSLWTLYWEALCYVLIAVLGVTGLLRRRWTVPLLFALAVAWSVKAPMMNWLVEMPAGQKPPVDEAAELLIAQAAAARFAIMFLAGALIYQFRHLIPARWWVVAVCVGVVLGASLLPNYRVLAALPLAYALIVSGALVQHSRLRLRTDLSYGVYIYAFPVQQLLMICGLGFLAPPAFAMLATFLTLPLAALSWFLIEKPALSWKSRMIRKNSSRTG